MPSRSGSSPIASSISRTARSIRSRSTDWLMELAWSASVAARALRARLSPRALIAWLDAERIGHRRDATRVAALAQARVLAVAAERQLLAVAGRGQREFLRRQHRRPVRRHPLAVAGVGATRRPLLHRGEDLEHLV